MSKENRALAEKIVKKFGQHSEEIVHDFDPETRENIPTDEKLQMVRIIDVAGYVRSATAPTVKEAEKELVDFFTSELDEGNLVLSDTWAEDNL